MNKFKMKVTAVIGVILLIGIYYYVTLPAINIHASEFWMYLVVLVILAAVVFIRKKNLNRYDWKESKGLKVILGILAVLVIAYVAGSVLSSPIVNAKKYQELLTVKNGEFTKDIEELSFDQIPLLDKDSAELLGDRKMGSMVDMVSQFEVDELYSQINYQDQPVRVSPLKYASVIKWFTNMREGIPAYIKIDMATQNTELVKLSEGMKYTTSDHFNRNIYRHLRFNYPTYIFNDLSFEIDEDGVPYWICPVKKYNIGLFGGTTIGRVVLCNAITGETKDYAVEDVPQWVDRVYSADLLVELYNYHGTLKHGFFNSVLGQKDCLNTTDGYNYLAIDDDVWVYTGVTSITGDQSNVGFVLMNQRTMETKFYEIEGATESSAMSSAEGQVQNLHYKTEAEDTRSIETLTAKITKIAQGVIDGDSHYYIMLEGSDEIFDVSVVDFIDIIRFNVGDEVTVEYKKGEQVDTVLSLNGKASEQISTKAAKEEQAEDTAGDSAQTE